MSASERIIINVIEIIEILILNSTGVPVTGLSNVYIRIRRVSDNFFLDFFDNTFKASGHDTIQVAMTEIDATNDPGKYQYSFNTNGHGGQSFVYRIECASSANTPQCGEIKTEGQQNNLDATISSRGSQTDITAIKVKTDNLPSGVKKNTALPGFEFYMVDSNDTKLGKTNLAVTAQRSIDGGAFAACANSVTEVGNGIYKIDLAAADLNGDIITLLFTASGAVALPVTFKTDI